MKPLRLVFLSLFLSTPLLGQAPRCVDERLEMELFAKAPQIVQPVSAIVDRRGRLLVIENHTHFRPDDYQGPATDRIRIIEDTNGDGAADKFTTFFEGEKNSMDLALHPDGSIYLATRMQILRLIDADQDDKVDNVEPVIKLETKGDYPHNGLSGLTFDFDGNLYFGFGENLGAAYSVIGSDGHSIEDKADGGSVFWCKADGSALRRVARGFWNPFGQCTDSFENLFAVDNDPDASPPCRLIHVVEGADYGYQFRFGRSGKHPLQTWNGKLPGTLPMVAGTGEAPCEVICYEDVGLPEEYLGDLIVASWGDHRIERFRLKSKGASFEAERSIVVQGDATFWPVGIAVAHDGSLYITDWGSSSYPLHNEGKIWRLKAKADVPPLSSKYDTATHTVSPIRWKREHVSKRADKETVLDLLEHPNRFVRATGVLASARYGFRSELKALANRDKSADVQALAIRVLAGMGEDVDSFMQSTNSPLARAASVRSSQKTYEQLKETLRDPDATLRTLAIANLASDPKEVRRAVLKVVTKQVEDEQERLSICLAAKRSGLWPDRMIRYMLKSSEEEIRLLGGLWAAEKKAIEWLPEVDEAMRRPANDFNVVLGLLAARQHLDGGKLDDSSRGELLMDIVMDPSQTERSLVSALRACNPGDLDFRVAKKLLNSRSLPVQREVVYLLSDDPREKALAILNSVIASTKIPDDLRADALVAIDAMGRETSTLIKLSREKNDLSKTAKRLLMKQSDAPQRSREATLAACREFGDPEKGRRLFANRRLLKCIECHAVGNRGAKIGPDLTGVGKSQTPQQLLRSILYPSERVSPQFQGWTIINKSGVAKTGYHYSSNSRVETFINAAGEPFEIHQDQIEERHALDTSIMPEGLVDHLTIDELKDLLGYLAE